MKLAIICGISGQDASYLTKFLLAKNYKIIGTTRRISNKNTKNLINISCDLRKIKIIKVNFLNYKEVKDLIIKYKPDELYNLAGQSLVDLSFRKPDKLLADSLRSTLNILENIKKYSKLTKVFFASSGQIYGNTKNKIINEDSTLKPLSPYAVSKAIQYYTIKNYREVYSLFICNGILFNHESALRKNEFVTQKIISYINLLSKKQNKNKKLNLSNINIYRDWGWAPEYAEGMWLILQHNKPEDFIISTGEFNSLKTFIKLAFKFKKMNWKEYVKIKKETYHKIDLKFSGAKPTKIYKILKWKPKIKMKQVIKKMLNKELN